MDNFLDDISAPAPAAAAHQDPAPEGDMFAGMNVAQSSTSNKAIDDIFGDDAPAPASEPSSTKAPQPGGNMEFAAPTAVPNLAAAPVPEADTAAVAQKRVQQTPQEMRQALRARAATAVAEQRREIAARTAAKDQAVAIKDTTTKQAAADWLKNRDDTRDNVIKATRSKHLQEQEAYAQKMTQLQRSGEVWASAAMIVDLKKPNLHSKNTETLRRIMQELSQKK